MLLRHFWLVFRVCDDCFWCFSSRDLCGACSPQEFSVDLQQLSAAKIWTPSRERSQG